MSTTFRNRGCRPRGRIRPPILAPRTGRGHAQAWAALGVLALVVVFAAANCAWAGAPTAEAVPAGTAAGHGSVAKGGEHAGPGLLDFDWRILVAQLFNFYLLLWLLKRFLFGPAHEMLERRRQKVADELSGAAEANARALELREQYDAKIASAQSEAHAIVQKATIEAQQNKEEITAAARVQAQKIVDHAHVMIQRERQRAWLELRSDVVNLTMKTTERLVQRSIDEKTQREIIERMIVDLEKLS